MLRPRVPAFMDRVERVAERPRAAFGALVTGLTLLAPVGLALA